MSEWKVHLDRKDNEIYKDEARWSITNGLDVDCGGWKTDSGYDGYGLPKELAEWICKILNESNTECPYVNNNGYWEKVDE
jgi:hypothetical protein